MSVYSLPRGRVVIVVRISVGGSARKLTTHVMKAYYICEYRHAVAG